MSDAWLLFRVLLKNSISLDLNTKKGKRGLGAVVILAVCLLPSLGLLYVSFLETFRTGALDGLYLEAGLLLPALIAAVMALFVVPTAFYFSRDIQLLLPLPVTGRDILLAKTGLVLVSQVSMGILFALPVFAAYYTVHPDPVKILFGLIVLVTVALIPVSVVGLLVIVLMRLIPSLRNQDRFNLIFGILSLVFAVGISVMSSSAGADDKTLPEILTDPNTLTIAQFGFWQLAWAARAVAAGSLTDLLLYLAATFLCLILFLEGAGRLYLSSVTTVSGSVKKARKQRREKARSPLMACLMAENRMLLRTPAWFMNCVLSSFIPTVILIVILFVQDVPSLLQDMPIPSLTAWMPAIGAGFALGFGSVNFIAATAFSREGQNLWRLKVLPVSFRTQILTKGLLGFLWSMAATVPALLFLVWILRGSVLDFLLLFAGTLVGSAFVNGLGLMVDGWHPKLVWDDETMAVKNNFNGIIEMMGSWLVVGLLLLPLLVLWPMGHAVLWLNAAVLILAGLDAVMILKGPGLIAAWLENRI